MEIRDLVADFTQKLTSLVEAQVLERARGVVSSALGDNTNGRPRARRKLPVQLCPAPGCKNRAAPVFGMVCADHKDLPKAKIKKYREARRRAKGKTTK